MPEAICNYLALLGWSPGDDKENISMQELVNLFTIERVNSSPARFDMKKLEAINGDKIRALTLEKFMEWSLPFLLESKVISGTQYELAVIKSALPIIQERIIKLSEIPAMLNFLFVKDFSIAPDEVSKVTDEVSQKVLITTLSKLEGLNNWNTKEIESVLRAVLIDEMGLKPRVAFEAISCTVPPLSL